MLVLNERLTRIGRSSTVTFEKEGPDNAPTFRAFLSIEGIPVQTGSGSTKQDAHNAAAARALSQLIFLPSSRGIEAAPSLE